ncbi:MAG: response regulator transcription factor [Bacteroidales bacterium]|jgi:DNA-binding NarL/FixJ family response regulator|nr:response regulator transcription factor [Bacteroidales bacterium]
MDTAQITVFLVDDHDIVRDGIRALLKDDSYIEIIGEAASGDECVQSLQTITPHVVLMDINLPDMTGIELTEQIIKMYPQLNIIMLSMHLGSDFILNSIEAGAKGYVPKTISQQELIEAIHTVADGKEYYSNEVSEILLQNYISQTKQLSKQVEVPTVTLTSRETEILTLFAEGLSNKEIASRLFISIRTVESHKNNIMQKLDVKSSVDLVKYAIKHNLIDI